MKQGSHNEGLEHKAIKVCDQVQGSTVRLEFNHDQKLDDKM